MRWLPVAGSISQIAARPSSSFRPFSPMLEFEPTPTYRRDPSALATRLLVQWWFRCAGRSTILRGAAEICVCPA